MSAYYGLFAAALLIGVSLTRISLRWLPIGQFSHFDPRLLTAIFCGLATAPLFDGESAAMWLHGAAGALSFTLVQLLLLCGLQQPLPRLPRSILLTGIIGGVVFYVLALGIGEIDPYGLGYTGLWLPLALLAVGASLWQRRLNLWLCILGLDLAAYALGFFDNLWNALFDPLLLLWLIIELIRQTLILRRYRRHAE